MESLPPAERPQFSQPWQPHAAFDVVECTFGTVPQRIVHWHTSNVYLTLTAHCTDRHSEPPTFTFTDFSSYLQPYIPLPFDVSDKFHSMQVSVSQSTEYKITTRSQAISEHWHKLRKTSSLHLSLSVSAAEVVIMTP